MTHVEELEQSNLQFQDHNTLLKARLATNATTPLPTENEKIINSLNSHLSDRIRHLEMENKERQAEIDSLRKDQDDLLELLTDQEVKLNTFKSRLIDLGENIEDGESDNVSVTSDN